MSLKKYKNFGISCLVAGAMVLGGLSFFQPAKVYAAEVLPQSFEYNIGDMGLSVGDQADTKLCWAYTSSKVLETLIYNATSPNVAVNISEEWIGLAYMYYVNDDSQSLISEGKTTDDRTTYQYGETGIPHFFQRVVSAYGIMLEEDFSLTEAITSQNYKQIFEASQNKAHKDIVVDFDVLWVGQINGYSSEAQIVGDIKNYLVNYGAVYTAVEGITAGAEDYYVYHETTADLKHAMTIIGFDDTKQIDVGGEVKTGAFTLLNSYGDYQQIVYMPYEMMAPNIQDNTEINKVLSNTFVFDNVQFYTGSGDDDPDEPTDPNQPIEPNPDDPINPNDPVDPNEPVDPNPDNPTEPDNPNEPTDPDTPTDPNEPTEPEGPDDPNQPDDPNTPIIPEDPNDGPNDPNEDISSGSGTTNNIDQILENLMGRYGEKSGGEKAVVVFAVLAMLGLAGVGIGLGVATFINRSRTAAINQSAFGDSVQQYRQHQLSLAQQKADLEKQIAEMRAEAKKRKQRRLKREFRKKLEENQ